MYIPSAAVKDLIMSESQWFSPDHGQIGHYLRDVHKNYKKYLDGAKRQAYKSKTEFSWDKMKNNLILPFLLIFRYSLKKQNLNSQN
jgi:hypothetical protein